MRAEMRTKDLSITIVTQSGVTTEEDKEKGKIPVTDVWV